MHQTLNYNLADALRMDSMALQLVPDELVRELVTLTGQHQPDEIAVVAVLISRGNMTINIGGNTANVPVEAGSVWSLAQLSQLYASIERVATAHPELWSRYVARARIAVADMSPRAELMSAEEHAALHGHEHHAPEVPAQAQSDDEPRPGMYL